MLKKLIAAVLVLVVLVIIGVIVALMYANSLVQRGIEYAGTRATGQATTLDSASVGLLSGELKLTNLAIAQPAGFDGPYFFHLGESEAAVSLGSLMKDTIEVPLIRFDRMDLTIARNNEGQNNFDVILDHLKSLSSSSPSQTPSQQPAPSGGKAGKGFVIKKLAIENVTVHLSGFGKEMEPIKLPPIVLENIGSESTGGVVASQLAGIVLRQIMIEVMKNPGQLPAFALASLNQGLAGVGSLGEVGLVRVGKVGEDVNSLISGAGGDVESAVGNVLGEGAGKAAGGVFDSLGAASENAVKGQTDKLGDKMNENLNKASGALGNLLGGDKQQQQDEQDKSQ